jgi:hypothetical protein
LARKKTLWACAGYFRVVGIEHFAQSSLIFSAVVTL